MYVMSWVSESCHRCWQHEGAVEAAAACAVTCVFKVVCTTFSYSIDIDGALPRRRIFTAGNELDAAIYISKKQSLFSNKR